MSILKWFGATLVLSVMSYGFVASGAGTANAGQSVQGDSSFAYCHEECVNGPGGRPVCTYVCDAITQ